MTRITFGKRMGLLLVLGHLLVSLMIVGLAVWISSNGAAHRDAMFDLLKISVPVTTAYATTVLTWVGAIGTSTERQSRRKMDRTEAWMYGVVIGAFILCLLAVPILLATQATSPARDMVEISRAATTYFAAIELIFGTIMAIIMRTLFSQA